MAANLVPPSRRLPPNLEPPPSRRCRTPTAHQASTAQRARWLPLVSVLDGDGELDDAALRSITRALDGRLLDHGRAVNPDLRFNGGELPMHPAVEAAARSAAEKACWSVFLHHLPDAQHAMGPTCPKASALSTEYMLHSVLRAPHHGTRWWHECESGHDRWLQRWGLLYFWNPDHAFDSIPGYAIHHSDDLEYDSDNDALHYDDCGYDYD